MPAFATTASHPPSAATASATAARTAARSRTSKLEVAAAPGTSAMGAPALSQAATAQSQAAREATMARPIPPAAPLTMKRRAHGAVLVIRRHARESVTAPVALGNVGGILVPVPRARVTAVVVGRIARVERIADPADRQRLVHERAVGAIEREALAAVAPVVRLVGHPERVRPLVTPHAHEPLPRATRVHLEGELLVVL